MSLAIKLNRSQIEDLFGGVDNARQALGENYANMDFSIDADASTAEAKGNTVACSANVQAEGIKKSSSW